MCSSYLVEFHFRKGLWVVMSREKEGSLEARKDVGTSGLSLRDTVRRTV